jgi:FlaA1/EpsC-like NDP-sugar epimerase/lipopolysaccharide/colanic/teichoic acid biosynthesis glycosyltransferase
MPSASFGAGLPRPLEILFSALALVLLGPFVLLAMAAVALTSGRPVLFKQKRVGRHGRPFQVYKLRTMTRGSRGISVTPNGDQRITRIGRILRQTKVDELPALWNVIIGDMAIVGPRPEVPDYVDLEVPDWRQVLQARPGLTDPVTLNLRNEGKLLAEVVGDPEDFYLSTLQPLKIAGYIEYLKERNWWTDITIILQTIFFVVFPSWAPVEWDRQQIDSALVGAANGKMKTRVASISHAWTPVRLWWTRVLTRQTQFCLDLIILTGAFALAYLLRFDFALTSASLRSALVQLPYVVTIQCAVLLLTGIYTFIWRYVGMAEIKTFVMAAVWSALPLVVIRMGLPERFAILQVPLSVTIVDTLIAFSAILGIRVARRLAFERYGRGAKGKATASGGRSVLLIGAGKTGVLAVDQILGRDDLDLHVKGFVDDDINKQRAVIRGIKVLGTTHDLPDLVRQHEIDHVIISIAHSSRNNFRRILDICEEIPVKVRIIPAISSILNGDVRISRIRDVEIEDLLGREPIHLDERPLLKFLAGKRVMVTGAGGSIGSELIRQIARFRPASLLLVERAEFALFNIELELRESFSHLEILPLVADVCDEARMRSLFRTHRPEVILHAAAHKHVPMMESNPIEAVKNNVLGTRLVGQLAGEFGVGAFVLISTDKAVRPKSVMGATKRVAELVIQDLDRRFETKYLAVRFGNVIGSAGSVIPIFRHQIQKGGPVTVTHKEMKRYFMTIPEAARLVLQAAAMGNGGEIFILDMGEPVSILDLAKETITLSGLKPFEDIDIIFTGVRAGEKLFEELDWSNEPITKTRHPKIFIGQIAPYPAGRVQQAIASLESFVKQGLEYKMCAYLDDLLPEANLEIIDRLALVPEEPLIRRHTA